MDAIFNEKGHQVPDPTPVEVPVAFRRPPTMDEMIRAHIRREMSLQAQAQGLETFEEADDFDVDEDPDPVSEYEVQDMIPEFRDEGGLDGTGKTGGSVEGKPETPTGNKGADASSTEGKSVTAEGSGKAPES